jgi:hypothetical protein
MQCPAVNSLQGVFQSTGACIAAAEGLLKLGCGMGHHNHFHEASFPNIEKRHGDLAAFKGLHRATR